jgi:hypothetical protein
MSGSKLAYHLRVNKYVDRQLFLEALELVGRFQPLAEAGYISMGGWNLEDFRVIHQAFNIRAMLSFDMDEWVVSRQRINRPYGFIRCKQATSEDIVDQFHKFRAETVGENRNVIVWLDYTEAAERYDQLDQLERLTGKLIHGDVFRITLNAHRESFGTYEEYQLAKHAEKTDQPTLADWRLEKLVDQLKEEYFPPERRDSEFMDSELEFAVTLVRAVKRAALNGLTSRPELLVEPLLTVTYADGQRMLTFTGLVLRADQRKEFRKSADWGKWPYKPGDDWDDYVALAVPHVSLRERQLLHAMMYFHEWSDAASLLEFRLDGQPKKHVELVGQYRDHYRRYPTFAHSDIL